MTKECRNPNDERESVDSDDFELRHSSFYLRSASWITITLISFSAQAMCAWLRSSRVPGGTKLSQPFQSVHLMLWRNPLFTSNYMAKPLLRFGIASARCIPKENGSIPQRF